MAREPLISVVIPSYDETEHFLRECFQSLLGQTLSEWEAIVVDDGSGRGTIARVVAELGDPRFSVIKHPHNQGLGAARNSGIRAARAPLIALLDADDRLAPSFLESTYHALVGDPGIDWVVVDWQVFGTRNEVWPFPVNQSLNCPAHFLFVGAGALMRKRVWELIGGYSEEESLRGGEDWDFWIGAAERNLRPTYISQPLYLYRFHPQQMSFATAPSAYVARAALYRRHKAAFESMGLDCPHCPSPKKRVRMFLAQGYLSSSYASLSQGQRLRAIKLAACGFGLQPHDPAALKQLARSLLPRPVWTVLGRLGKVPGRAVQRPGSSPTYPDRSRPRP